MLSISVLGSVEVDRGGEPVAVPAGKTSELLVRLALDAGRVVRTDRLVDELWGDAALTTSRNTVQSKVTKLRRALADAAVVESVDGGYVLHIDPASVDALDLLDRTPAAIALLDAGDAASAVGLCAQLLAMFRGEPLMGTGEWAEPHRARLDAARMLLVETGFAARLAVGNAGDVVGDLEAAVVSAPYQENLWGLLVTALYRAGRQADALSALQRVRRVLGDELGLEPGPRLQQLEQQILTHDAALVLDAPRATGPAPWGNLPSMAVDLIGRDVEVATVCELVRAHRLVEIVGPGGIGKTAVALAAGRRLGVGDDSVPGGVWLARLETAVTPNDVVDAVVAALDVTGGEASMIERLRTTSSVVILDNCEHVVDAAGELAVRLLDAAPSLRILCTSQLPLGVDGEALFELAPLALSDAVELFERRAAAQRQNRPTVEGDGAVTELCRSLDGLPLAIELAAARTKTLSVAEITRRLDDRFNVLNDPSSRRPERRRALRATIRWSYDLLFPDDQRGLWALATFAGGATLDAVEHVLAALDVPAAAALDVVGRLASRSLVIVDDDGSSTVRYRLLDSIRAFALEQLAEAGLTEPALAAHAQWFADLARASTDGVRSGGQASFLLAAKAERANIDAALGWTARNQPLLALTLANGFGWAWVVLGDSRGAERIMAAHAAAGPSAPARERAGALLLAGWMQASAGALQVAREQIDAAISIAEQIDDVELQARGAYFLAYVVCHNGEFREGMALTDRSDALFAQLDRPWDQAANWLFAARAAISAGDQERSVSSFAHVDRWLAVVDDPWLHVRAEAMRGELARVQGRFDDAVAHIARAAAVSHRLGFLQTEAYQVASLGRAQCQAGDDETGAATLQLAIDKAEATGDARMATLARVHLGRVLRALGRRAEARVALEAAAAWHRRVGGGEQAPLGECLLAAIDAVDGVDGARQRLVAVLAVARERDEAHVEVFALDALGRLAAEAGDADAARTMWAQADERMAAAAHFITERDRTDSAMR